MLSRVQHALWGKMRRLQSTTTQQATSSDLFVATHYGESSEPGEGNANVYANLARGRLSCAFRRLCVFLGPRQGLQERQERQSLLTKRDARDPMLSFQCRFDVSAWQARGSLEVVYTCVKGPSHFAAWVARRQMVRRCRKLGTRNAAMSGRLASRRLFRHSTKQKSTSLVKSFQREL